jgi:4-diphosphocytidyl-2-C-methyl-D-erythritol kinase
MVTEQAYAKINLTLHVTGQRADGYHLLDSLVVFVGVGDVLSAKRTGIGALTIEGPFGHDIPLGADNLVLRAAQAFDGADITFSLVKNLPPASGIGGGSADAAAAIRAVLRLRAAGTVPALTVNDQARLADLGADVPVCLLSQPSRMRGVGEILEPVAVPACWITLANPRVEVPTPAVFRALTQKANPPMPEALPDWPDVAAFAAWLARQRNDLEAPARAIAPVIGTVLAALTATKGALLTRMSGSGATCFALYATQALAEAGAAQLRAKHPDWWVAPAPVLAGNPIPRQL